MKRDTTESRPPAAWHQLMQQLEEELAAAPRGERPARRDALRCQLALLCWDLAAQRDEAGAWLAGCSAAHPLAAELRRQLLLDAGDVEGATDQLEEEAGRLLDAGETVAATRLLQEAAQLQLFWALDAERAAELCQQAIDAGHPDDLTDLLELALGAAGEVERLATRALTEDIVTLPTLVNGALALWDRLGRPELALDLLLRAYDLDSGNPFIIELLLEASTRFPEVVERPRFIERKHQLLQRHGGEAAEVTATTFELCRLTAAAGDTERARRLWDQLAAAAALPERPPAGELRPGDTRPTSRLVPLGPGDADVGDADVGDADDEVTTDTAHREADDDEDPTTRPGDEPATGPGPARAAWATLALATLRRDLAAQAGDREALAEAYLALAELSGVPAFARVHRLRAAQIAERAGSFSDERIEALLERNLVDGHTDPHAAEMLQRLRLQRRRPAELCALYQILASGDGGRRGPLLRWAAIIAEAHLNDAALAASLRRDGLLAAPDTLGAGDLQRLYRRGGATGRLLDAYRRRIDSADDPEIVGVLCFASAALQLASEDLGQALGHAREALEALPDDPGTLLVLAELQRRTGDPDALQATLTTLGENLSAAANRQACLRELATLERDRERACEHLERARALGPADPATLRDLARHLREAGELARAAEVLEELGRVAVDPATAATAHREAGQLALEAGDEARALEALLAAVRLAPDEVALSQIEEIYRGRGDRPGLIETLRQQLALLDPAGERADRARARLLLRLGETLAEAGEERESLDALSEAARLDPSADDALVALDRACRAQQRWRQLVEVLAELPPRPLVLDLQAEALEQLGELEALVELRSRLLELAADGRDRADRAYDLGRAHEQRRRIDEALESYRLGLEEVADHRPSLRALQRIYQAAGDQDALERVLEQEHAVETNPRRRVDLLLELARCSEQTLPELSISRLEQALKLAPDNRDVIDALDRYYEALPRPLEHARLLRHRAEIESRPALRAKLYLRAAEGLLAQGAEREADEAFRAAVAANPGNRDAFTAYELFCYERDRWRELMEMYETTLRFIEQGGERVYRLSDLHARRGQLQLDQLGQPGEATASFFTVLEHDPKSELAMEALQRIFVHQQDWRGLIRAYEHRARLLPDNESFRVESLRQAARIASGRLPAKDPQTVELWRAVHEASPADEEALERLEQLYRRHVDHERLADLLEERLASQPAPTIEDYLRLAELTERQLEDPVRAARAYEAIRGIAEHDERALKELARIYEATGHWQACLGALRDLVIIEADPEERSLLYFKVGSILESRFDDDGGAIEAYQSSLDESPGCLPAIHGLRDVYLRRGEWFEALRTLEHELRLWEGEREEAGVLARMAEIRLRHLQQRDKAIEEFEDALALDPDCRPALTALFDLRYEDGDGPRALALAERLAPTLLKEGDPEQRGIFFGRRGELLAEAADDDDDERLALAAESLLTALRLNPADLSTLERLIALLRRCPEAYDFALGFRELEQLYRNQGDSPAVGHVLVAAGALSENANDVDAALELYEQAEETAPGAFAPVKARADALVGIRRTAEAVAALERFVARLAEDAPARIEAMYMLGEIAADGEMDAERAAQRFAEVLALDPTRHAVALRLAQGLNLLGRFDDARRTLERLNDDAEQAGCSGAERARYQHYLGVTLLQTHGRAEATAAFRRALQLDPACAEASLALARQLVLAGARDQAEELLTHSIHETSRRRGAVAAGLLDLRRSLSGIYLGDGRFDEALAEYRTILAAGGGQVEDHLTVAGIYALEDATLPQAIAELQRVLADDPFNPHAFGMLAQLYDRQGEMDRTMQVLQVSELLGVLSDEERRRAAQLRHQLAWKPSRALDDRLRQLCRVEEQDAFVERMWEIARDALERVFPLELGGPKPQPADQAGDADLRLMINHCLRLTRVKASVLVADSVPGGVAADGVDHRVIIDRLLLEQPLPALAFGLGRSLELLRSGHALIGRLAFDDRMLLIELLNGLLEPPDDRSDLAEEFIRRLPRKAAEHLEELATSYQQQRLAGTVAQQAQRWIVDIERSANHVGLLSCDDVGVALRMMALLSHQEQVVGPEGEVMIRALPDAPELIQFYLSDRYVRLRRHLAG